MRGNPQVKVVVRRFYTTNPKKPNSANRKVVKVQVGTGRHLLAAVKGIPHNLKKFSRGWVCGVGFKDTPGVNTKLIIGKENFCLPYYRPTRRSIYGLKKLASMWLIFKIFILCLFYSDSVMFSLFLLKVVLFLLLI